MLSALLKKQLQEIFRSYFYNAKQGKARSRASTLGYFAFFAVLMVGVLGGMFTYLAHSLCAPFAAAGMEWLYFTIMAMVAIVLGAFGSVFNTYSSLYLAKDNDLLLSMPIPVRTILLSRLLSVYLMGLLYSGVVLLPAMIVYWVTVSAAPAALAGGLLLFVLVTIFVLTLSCALGWLVARVSLKLKHRSITVVLASLLFLSAYYFVYFKAQSFLSELVTNAAYYGAQIRGKAYPLYLIGRAGAGDGPAMAVVTAVVLVLFVLLFWLLSRSFLRIATASGSTVRRVYREKTAVQRGAGTALLARELRHFGGNPSYMLNCGLGILLLPLGGTALLWKRDLLDVLQPMVGGQGIAHPVRAGVPAGIHESHGCAVRFARGPDALARAVTAGPAMAGPAGQAAAAACADGRPRADRGGLRSRGCRAPGGGDAPAAGRPARLCPAAGAVRPVRGPEAAEPDVDE